MTSESTTIDLITGSARRLFEREYDLGFMRAYRSAEKPDKARLVRLCQEMGWQGLLVDEEHGGFGHDLDAVCALLQELGQAAFPQLFLSHFVAPVLVLRVLPESAPRQRLLEEIAAGQAVPCMATSSATAEAFFGVGGFEVSGSGAGRVLNGLAALVCDADSASRLLLPATNADGSISVFALETDRPGMTITGQADYAYGSTFTIECKNVVPDERSDLGVVSRAVLREAYDRCAIAQSAAILGSAQRAMKFALEHIMVRKQFGKLLAEFQAVQHQAADMYRALDVAQLFLGEAVTRSGSGAARESASCCKAWTNDAAFQANATAHQLMGGTGYMQETNLHLLTSLMLRGQYEFGSADYHRELIADFGCEGSA